jgi:copper(I)-binding protein
LGSSSDHIILLSKNKNLKVGDEVNFNLDYGGLLAAMTSPFIKKHFVNGNDHAPAEYPYRTAAHRIPKQLTN